MSDSSRDTELANAGSILGSIVSERSRSRSDLIRELGLSRSTVTYRLKALIESNLIRETPEPAGRGGRPTHELTLNPDFNVSLVADIGETSVRIAVSSLAPEILSEQEIPVDLSIDPATTLELIVEQFQQLLDQVDRPFNQVFAVGLSVPAPVNYVSGQVFGPSVMTGWDGFDIRTWLEERLAVPVVVENDVNAMAFYEWRAYWPDCDNLFFVKLGDGIGSGIITRQGIFRGAQGVAGDIGHMQLNTADPALCRCGKRGCVEAEAAGWALVRDMNAFGLSALDAEDIVRLVRTNEPRAISAVRNAGRVIGEAIADSVSILNPSVIVIGGSLSALDDQILLGVREFVYQRSLPLATRQLQLGKAKSNRDAGLLGMVLLMIDHQMNAARVQSTLDRLVERQSRAIESP